MDISTLLIKEKKEKGKLISIILPVFNEEENIEFMINGLSHYLSQELPMYKFEVLFVDDCSTDNSFQLINQLSGKTHENVRFAAVRLAKNSGSHIAITAGLNLARGNFTMIMASDGQDPFQIVGELVAEWENGYDLVLAARQHNLGKDFIGNLFSLIAWRLMNWATKIKVPRKGCDLLGLDEKVLKAFNQIDERNTTFIYRILSLGFKQKEIEYVKLARHAGKTKWNTIKKFAIIIDAVKGYSSRPLKIITNIGYLAATVLILRWIFVMYKIYVLKKEPIELEIILNSLFTGLAVQVLILGFIGDYIWRILDETRKRPIYNICETIGHIFEDEKT